jgi:glucoamylase
VDPDDPRPLDDPDAGADKDVVDAGFLELVRYGIRAAGSALMEDSLRVVDSVLKVDTPAGPCWRRYNRDGYGQKDDGGPYEGWGRGRAWPLLTGERGHYELAAGRDPAPYILAMEKFASKGGMLPEQVWDARDIPEMGLFLGRPTGSAMPLMWAHAEYVKLLRSAHDGAVFDRIPVVAERYLSGKGRKDLEIWKFKRQPRVVAAGATLRIHDAAAFRLRWTLDDWKTSKDTPSVAAMPMIHSVDIVVPKSQRARVRFAFYRFESGSWDGRDFAVDVKGG